VNNEFENVSNEELMPLSEGTDNNYEEPQPEQRVSELRSELRVYLVRTRSRTQPKAIFRVGMTGVKTTSVWWEMIFPLALFAARNTVCDTGRHKQYTSFVYFVY
jgi:hypothetical protein